MAAGGGPLRRTLARRVIDWAAGFEDGQIIRAAFFGMLAATVCVIVIDYFELSARDTAAAAGTAAETPDLPILPAFDPNSPGGKPGPPVTTDLKLLQQPLAIALGSGGVLHLVGTIDRGAADRFAAAVVQYGEYVRTVALDSPGGSVPDALSMGKLIRDKGFATTVADGSICASSCPLVFAGGKKRTASPKAAIGIHQFYLAETAAELGKSLRLSGDKAASLAMAETQQTTAEITRFLSDMGVEPALWLHALDTPPSQIYYFSPAELAILKLVTNLNN